MKKYLPLVAGIVLGLLFVMASAMFLLKLVPEPKLPEGSPISHFMSAVGPTGYMHFVKVFELLGGILVAVPRTRNLGLLVLGPIILNILAFHLFIASPKGLLDPMLVIIVLLALYLVWVERRAFGGLVTCSRNSASSSPPSSRCC